MLTTAFITSSYLKSWLLFSKQCIVKFNSSLKWQRRNGSRSLPNATLYWCSSQGESHLMSIVKGSVCGTSSIKCHILNMLSYKYSFHFSKIRLFSNLQSWAKKKKMFSLTEDYLSHHIYQKFFIILRIANIGSNICRYKNLRKSSDPTEFIR